MSRFQDAKLVLIDLTDLSKDALHVYFGLAVLFGVAFILRKSVADWRPLAAVGIAAAAGEILDLMGGLADGTGLKWQAGWRDIWNTMFWPAVIFGLARFTGVMKR